MSGLSGIVKLVIFGATGQTGGLVTERGVAKGHQVTAFVRDPARMDLLGGSARVIQGDVLDSSAVVREVAGQEAVLVVLVTASCSSLKQHLQQGERPHHLACT